MNPAVEMNPTAEDNTYIDYEAFLSPSFSAYSFAHTLLTSTHDLSDTTLTLTTPLSRVLFDLQEIDTHLHTLTSSSALPLLKYTATTTALSTTTTSTLSSHLETLQTAYARLQSAITTRTITATQVLTATRNLHVTTTLLRDITRSLSAARSLDANLSSSDLLRAAQALLDLRSSLPSVEDCRIVTELRALVLVPGEREVVRRAREKLAEGGAGALWVLSPEVCVAAVETAVNDAVGATVGVLRGTLAALTMLERGVAEVVRIREGVEALGKGVRGEVVDAVTGGGRGGLIGVFFRGVAEGVEGVVREVLGRGGSNARILRGAKERVRAGLRACVERDREGTEGMELEVAVMVGAVAALGR